jgi:23S rRNA pseudouridine1911/1915/1917 synthase
VPADQAVFIAGPGDARRLDMFLAGSAAGLSRAAAQRLIRNGAVRLNGDAVLRPSANVDPGDRIELTADSGQPVMEHEASPATRIGIAYEDDWILVVDKPAGLTVHPGAGSRGWTMVDALVEMRPQIAGVGPDPARPGIVHRLDKDTSGLLAVAKTAEAHERLAAAVKGRTIIRRYTALVWGRVVPEGGIIDAPVGRHPTRRQRQAITTTGRPARTGYRVLRHLPGTSLVLCTLQTGRMHQIRVHMASVGFPVVGDPTYGRPGFGLRRQFLHASYLAFDHPFTGERIEAESPLPPDLQFALQAAESGARESDRLP